MTVQYQRLRVVTYNIHKCRGLEGKVSAARIAGVLSKLDADIIALQEVLSIEGGAPEADQARYLASELSLHHAPGITRTLRGGAYGNLLLSRFPVRAFTNYDLSVRGRERRGCVRADIEFDVRRALHVFNVHLGTAFMERRRQGRALVTEQVLCDRALPGPRLVLGDFNEWVRGLATRLLTEQFRRADLRGRVRRRGSYPGLLPLLHLDHIYHDPELELEEVRLVRTRESLIASDHLPLMADFRVRV